ncbi:hypothetical protein HDU67_009054 [Dinochytrium kinnereticum]|nr:hypothetical protein HDU67_009054 [Dinochytrium kinnereticum]
MDAQQRSGAPANNPNFHDMLVEVINECQDLRRANEQLQEMVENLRADLSLKENCIKELEVSSRSHLETIAELDITRNRELNRLQERLNQQTDELQSLRSDTAQISSIRATLAKEKELDLLNCKKELMMQKESEIQQLRKELLSQKESIDEAERVELRNMIADLERLNVDLQNELSATKQRDASRSKLQEKRSRVVAVQCDLGDQLVKARLLEKDDIITTLTTQLRDAERYSDTITTEVEVEHRRHLEQLKKSHDFETESLKGSFNLQIKLLQDENASLQHRLRERPDPSSTLPDVQRIYPSQFKEFENILKQGFRKEQETLYLTHADEVRRLQQDFEMERMGLNEKYHEEVRKTIEVVKGKCFVAYENAVQKLKQDFVSFQQNTMAGQRKSRNCSNCTSKESVIGQYESTISDLNQILAETKQQHQSDIQEIRQRFTDEVSRLQAEFRAHYTKQLREALEKMKIKYLSLLQTRGR